MLKATKGGHYRLCSSPSKRGYEVVTNFTTIVNFTVQRMLIGVGAHDDDDDECE